MSYYAPGTDNKHAPWNWPEPKISFDVQYFETGKGWILADNFEDESDAIRHAEKLSRFDDVRVLKFIGDDEEKQIWVIYELCRENRKSFAE